MTWTHPTALDTLTTERGAQRVQLLHPDRAFHAVDNPRVIAPDWMLRVLAAYIIRCDEVARHNAFSRYDFSGASSPSNEAACFDVIERNKGFDIDAFLQDLADGRPIKSLPDASGGDIFSEDIRRPDLFVILPVMARSPRGGYSQAPAVSRATLLNQIRVARQAVNVATDAGLAGIIADNWADTRAALLAAAQARYPERAYT